MSNCAKSRLRHESRTVNLEDADYSNSNPIDPSRFNNKGHWQSPPNVGHADTPDAILASSELKTVVNTALRSLPPLQQAEVILRDLQGVDMDTICKILEVSESYSRVLLHRARSELREAINEYQGNH